MTHEPWSEEWSSTFREDAKILRRVLNSSNLVVNIHHVGSTSIQGLLAKPIVDIMMEVTSVEDFDKHRNVRLNYKTFSAFSPFAFFSVYYVIYFNQVAYQVLLCIEAFHMS